MKQQDIINGFNKILENSDKLWIQRKRKITTANLFYTLVDSMINNYGIRQSIALNNLSNNNYNVSDAAICKARQRCDISVFNNIQQQLINQFITNKHHIYAVDGSKFHLPDSFQNIGYTTRDTKSKKILAMISCVFDVYNNIPINTSLVNHFNERKAFIDQLSSFKISSTFIFDRGYYSIQLVKKLFEENHNFIFRLKKDANSIIYKIWKNNRISDKYIVIDGVTVRIFKYKINGQIYMCLTNLTDDISHLQYLYKLRWKVEEGFKIFKSYLHLNSIHSFTNKLLYQEIIIRQIVFILSRLIQLNTIIKKKYGQLSIKFIMRILTIYNFHIVIFIDSIINQINKFHHINIPNRQRT